MISIILVDLYNDKPTLQEIKRYFNRNILNGENEKTTIDYLKEYSN